MLVALKSWNDWNKWIKIKKYFCLHYTLARNSLACLITQHCVRLLPKILLVFFSKTGFWTGLLKVSHLWSLKLNFERNITKKTFFFEQRIIQILSWAICITEIINKTELNQVCWCCIAFLKITATAYY